MRLPRPLVVELAALTGSLDDPSVDLERSVASLASAVRAAVRSYLGLCLRFGADGRPMLLTFFDDADGRDHVGASLRIPPLLGGGLRSGDADPGRGVAAVGGVTLILYAAAPGAFVDLAADLVWVTGRDVSAFEVDRHLPGDYSEAVATHLSDWFATNQAVGVLIASGLTLKEAEEQLDARARRLGVSRHVAAVTVLDGLPKPPDAVR